MSIDIHTERMCTLKQAAELLPPLDNGKRLHPITIWRWCRRGVSGIHLEHVRVGAKVYTSAEALNRFCNALAAADLERAKARRQRQQPSTPRRPESPRRSKAEIEEKLRRAGL